MQGVEVWVGQHLNYLGADSGVNFRGEVMWLDLRLTYISDVTHSVRHGL